MVGTSVGVMPFFHKPENDQRVQQHRNRCGSLDRMATPALSADFADPSRPFADHTAPEKTYSHAVELDERGSAECVSWYLATAQQLWPQASLGVAKPRETQLYRSSIGRLLEAAQRFEVFDIERGAIRHHSRDSGSQASIRLVGFNWHPSEVEKISVAGDYDAGEDIRPFRQTGLGQPVLFHINTERKFVYSDEVKPALGSRCGITGWELHMTLRVVRVAITGV